MRKPESVRQVYTLSLETSSIHRFYVKWGTDLSTVRDLFVCYIKRKHEDV